MKTPTRGMNKARWMVAVIAVIAVAGASGGAIAKDKKATEKGGETGNGKGYIGVYSQELTDEVKKGLDLEVTKGVLVSGVEDDAPAALAGVEEGDVIVKINGKPVASPEELRAAVGAIAPGTAAKVEVVRDGKSKTITVTVGERPERHSIHWESDGDDMAPMHFAREFAMLGGPRLGVEAHELEDEGLASYFGAKKGEGVLVLFVDEESVAAKAGVKAGDIISRVGDEKIADVQDVHQALKDYDKGEQFDITVLRHGKSQSLKATMDEQSREFAFTMPGGDDHHFKMFTPRAPRAPRTPRVWVDGDNDDLRRELDDLKKELRELKEELEDKNDG